MANAIHLETKNSRKMRLPRRKAHLRNQVQLLMRGKRNLKDRTFVGGYFVLIKRFGLCVIITTCRLFGLAGVTPQDFVGRLIVQILVWLVQCEVQIHKHSSSFGAMITCLPSLMETCFANISNIFVAERSFEHITMTQSDGSDIL